MFVFERVESISNIGQKLFAAVKDDDYGKFSESTGVSGDEAHRIIGFIKQRKNNDKFR